MGGKIKPKKKKKKKGRKKEITCNKQTNNDDTCQGNKQKQNDKPSAAEDLECKTE
jgi:hypothetical protein